MKQDEKIFFLLGLIVVLVSFVTFLSKLNPLQNLVILGLTIYVLYTVKKGK